MTIARRLIKIEGDVEPFIVRIQTTTANKVLELPIYAADFRQPSIVVDWGDGSASTITSTTDPDRFHTYVSAGTYDITIAGFLSGFRVDNNSNYRSLYKAVVQWGNVGLITVSFYGCNNLTSIPSSGFIGLNSVINWNNTFRSTGLSTIPAGMFDESTSAQTFVDTFSYTGISTVPNNLFDNNTSVYSFSSCFNACTSLTSVPNELFRYNTQVANFSSTFRNCRNLQNIPTFQYNTNVTIFLNIFNMTSTSNQSSQWDLDEALWLRSPEPLGTTAFRNCTGIGTNPSSTYSYADIPSNWK